MTKEQKQLLEEMKSMCENLRAANINFIVTLCVAVEKEGEEFPHHIETDINAEDDHHVLDMQASQAECWWKANHKS